MLGRLSLQERLVVLVIVAVLPLLALPVWFAVHQARSATDLFQSQLKFAASLIATNQDRRVEAAEHLLGAISAMPEMRAPERKVCEKYFEALRGRYPIYANIGVFDTKGNVACHAQGRVGDFSASERPYFTRALAERRFVMGAPVMGKVSERFVLPFARPVFDGERVTGVVFATLDLGAAAAALDAADLPTGARVMVTDRHGVVLMERPAGSGLEPGAVVRDALLLDAARGMQAGTTVARGADDEQRLYAYAPGRLVGGEGFFAVVSIGSDQVTSASSAALRTVLAALLAALLVGLAAAWWVGGRVIVKPAKQILGTVRRLEQGRLDARVSMGSAGAPRGEFARIGAAFNLMADSLQVRQRNLEAELGRSRSAYEALDLVLNSMQEALVAVTSAGQFLMFNEAAARLLPLDGPPLLPRQWPEAFGFFHADGRTRYEVDEMPLVRSARGESGRQPLLFVRNARVPDGRMLQCSWQPIRGEGGISGGLVVFTDVTELERLQAEQAAQFEQLLETQRKLIEAQRIGRVGNWELDLETGRLWWSSEVYGLFGVPQERFVPTLDALERLVHPDDRALLKPARDAALRDGQAVNLEYRAIKPDGAVAWMHEIGEPRLDAHGAPVWFGGVVQDVTERKRVEQALLDSERELQDYTLMLQRAAEAAQRIMAHSSVDATLQEVVDQARHVIGARHAAVTLAGADSADAVARSGAIDADEASAGAGHRLSVPLVSRDGQPIGRLEISGKEGAFTERDEYVLLELAQLGSIAIENARLFTEIRELNAGLEARIAERTAELGAAGAAVSHARRAGARGGVEHRRHGPADFPEPRLVRAGGRHAGRLAGPQRHGRDPPGRPGRGRRELAALHARRCRRTRACAACARRTAATTRCRTRPRRCWTSTARWRSGSASTPTSPNSRRSSRRCAIPTRSSRRSRIRSRTTCARRWAPSPGSARPSRSGSRRPRTTSARATTWRASRPASRRWSS